MISTQYYIRVDYIPATYSRKEQDGSYRIKYFDEVANEIMGIDSRIVMCYGTPASDPYIECVVGSKDVAQHIEKVIHAKLTKYKYRVVE